MFNLLITHSEDAWLTSPSEILLNRFLEYTDIPNKKSFLAMTEKEMQQLLTPPAIFAYEKGSDTLARSLERSLKPKQKENSLIFSSKLLICLNSYLRRSSIPSHRSSTYTITS